MTHDIDELVAEYADQQAEQYEAERAEEIRTDLEMLTVALRGLMHRKRIVGLRVFVDNHRSARRLKVPAQVAVMHLDGRLDWLQGYKWSFDEGSKSYVGGELVEEELEKITQMARAELERVRPEIEEVNKG